MNDRYQLIAYCSTLAAIVVLVGIGSILAYNGKSTEAVGVAAAVTGLIGVIKLPTARSPAANVENASTVVQATTPSPAGDGQAASADPAA